MTKKDVLLLLPGSQVSPPLSLTLNFADPRVRQSLCCTQLTPENFCACNDAVAHCSTYYHSAPVNSVVTENVND